MLGEHPKQLSCDDDSHLSSRKRDPNFHQVMTVTKGIIASELDHIARLRKVALGLGLKAADRINIR